MCRLDFNTLQNQQFCCYRNDVTLDVTLMSQFGINSEFKFTSDNLCIINQKIVKVLF
jgi:hypothetical protein